MRSEQCTQLSVHCFALQISNQTVALVSEVMIETNECILSGLRIGNLHDTEPFSPDPGLN